MRIIKDKVQIIIILCLLFFILGLLIGYETHKSEREEVYNAFLICKEEYDKAVPMNKYIPNPKLNISIEGIKWGRTTI